MEGELAGPRLSLKFIDVRNVQMLGEEGAPWGVNNGMCTYKIDGKGVHVQHACGVWALEIRKDALYKSDWKITFRRNYDRNSGRK